MSNQVLGTDTILRLNDFSLLGLVQSEDWQPNFNAQDIMELGNQAKVDTALELETSGTFELEASGNLAGLLARMIVTRGNSGEFTGFMYDPTDLGTGKNAYTITHSDMKEVQFDLIMHQRSAQGDFDRSVWFPRCFVSGFSGRVDSNGMATETVQWSGQDMTTLPDPYHDIRSVPGAKTDDLEVTLADTTVSSTTHELVYLYVNETRIRNDSTSDATKASLGASGVITITTSEGFVLPDTAIIMALVYKKTPSTTFPQLLDADRGTTARYIKGYQANIYLAPVLSGETPTLASSDLWLRAQSADFSVDTRLETLRQIKQNKAGTSIYCRVPTYPLNTSVNVSTYETDLEDWKAMLTKSFNGDDVYVDSFDWSPENIKSSFAVVFEYFTKSGAKLQQVDFTDLRVDGASSRTNVGGRSEVSWSLKGTKFKITGFNA